jgi:hypothetical protein
VADTFMQAVHEGAREAVNSEAGQEQLKGMNREQVVDAVGAVTKALDGLDGNTSLHVVLFALNFVRNSIIAVMDDNQRAMKTSGGKPS